MCADVRSPIGPALVESLVQAASQGAVPVRTEAFLALQAVADNFHILLQQHWDTLRAAVQVTLHAENVTGLKCDRGHAGLGWFSIGSP